MSKIEKRFGLLGKQIAYSFSRKYFTEKFAQLGLSQFEYVNYDLEQIEDFKKDVLKDLEFLGGLNVTIPYKEAVIPLLDQLDEDALQIGAVNTIKRNEQGQLIGYNTDHVGFSKALEPYLPLEIKKALILGSGGASKAVLYSLKKQDIACEVVSRSSNGQLSYEELTPDLMRDYGLIVNCTPLGTYPDIDRYPPIPIEGLGPGQLVYDLVYNPSKTRLMQLAEQKGCQTLNGYKMLVEQAEAAWEIWNS